MEEVKPFINPKYFYIAYFNSDTGYIYVDENNIHFNKGSAYDDMIRRRINYNNFKNELDVHLNPLLEERQDIENSFARTKNLKMRKDKRDMLMVIDSLINGITEEIRRRNVPMCKGKSIYTGKEDKYMLSKVMSGKELLED